MTFEELEKANSTIKTTEIKGKDYAEVNQRIRAFRMLFPEGTIQTNILENRDGMVLMKTSIFNGDKLLSTGYAYEVQNASMINKTSFIENCETSAVGRALGMLGIGIASSICSKEEVESAIQRQKAIELEAKSRPENEIQLRDSLIADISFYDENAIQRGIEAFGSVDAIPTEKLQAMKEFLVKKATK